LGAAIALPMLDAMLPSMGGVVRGANVAAGALPKRMAFVYIPNGATMPAWTPTGVGTGYELPRILQPLSTFKNDFQVLSGLAQEQGFAHGDGGGDHARASATFLTGVHPLKTAGRDLRAGISADQIAATHIGDQTRLSSLELSCDIGPRTGACDTGYSCAYQFNISWRSENMPMNPEVDPRLVFDRLFGDASVPVEQRTRRSMMHRSILDFVLNDAKELQRQLGRTDQRKVDEYLTAIREIEHRIELNEKYQIKVPDGVNEPEPFTSFEQHVRLMIDMLVLGFQTDSTRVATFIIGHEGSNRPYPFLGVTDGHHDISHHRNDPEKIEKLTTINTFHATQFAYLLEKMKSVKEGDGNLLDNSMIVYGSGLSDPNRHDHLDLPILLAGKGGGTLTPGRHVVSSKGTPLNNLYLSMLDRMGSPVARFGDSTGRLDAIA
jgi:Protein of unknown function (DUF1552)